MNFIFSEMLSNEWQLPKGGYWVATGIVSYTPNTVIFSDHILNPGEATNRDLPK